ncbi:N-acetyltransferase [Flavobacterium microcysteis]|uniref:N-acetyltransferase n=1 Tax=Flavobacterium microcysteis TaxID=2596891 RepID=A0A501QC40_9FLAO|nr:N-acetyltransferase [Flavobacterium microcysteis]TPD69737.1 N-acetyltransferase [Flavobacterium microcysteis]
MEIITKFIIATEQGRGIVATLAKEIAAEKFASLVEPQQLEDYIEKKFNDKNLIAEMNSMSNQWLVVYVGDTPAGYAYITSNGRKPKNQEEARMMRIADFGILEKYNDTTVRLSLLEKCLAISKSYNGLWVHEYKENPLIAFFESEGFVMQNEVYQHEELPLPSIFLTRNNL